MDQNQDQEVELQRICPQAATHQHVSTDEPAETDARRSSSISAEDSTRPSSSGSSNTGSGQHAPHSPQNGLESSSSNNSGTSHTAGTGPQQQRGAHPPAITDAAPDRVTNTNRAESRRLKSILEGLIWPFLMTLLFAFVSTISWQAQLTNWPLANISYTSGILLLSFLSKLTDWVLSGTVDKAWEKLQWGPLLRDGNLLTFLVMSSRMSAWRKVLFHRHRKPAPNSVASGIIGRALQLSEQFVAGLRSGGPRVWSALRIFIWFAIQFPGIIIMALVQQQTSYIPGEFRNVSGGVGLFDPSLVMFLPGNPTFSNYAFNILQDSTISIPVDPISDRCRDSEDCKSFAMSGGVNQVAPWPFRNLSGSGYTAYITENTPAYQLEVWNLHDNEDTDWSSKNCKVFSGARNSQTEFQLCVKDDNSTGGVLLGTRGCRYGIAESSGDCQQDGGWDASPLLSTAIAVYRCNLTVVSDRRTARVLEVLSTNSLWQQNIRASDAMAIATSIMCTFDNPSSYCDFNAAVNMLTDAVGSVVNLASIVPEIDTASQLIANLLATGLFVFNPVNWYSLPSPTEPVAGLPKENYFPGALARPVTYSTPERWTVAAYMISSGLLLILAMAAFLVSVFFDVVVMSAFPLVEFSRLHIREEDSEETAPNPQVGELEQLFSGLDADDDIIQAAEQTKIEYRDDSVTSNPGTTRTA